MENKANIKTAPIYTNLSWFNQEYIITKMNPMFLF